MKKFIFILISIIFALITIQGAFAFDFDNKAFFEETDDSYGIIRIKNMWGWFNNTLAVFELTNNSDTCWWDCWAEGTVTMNEDEQLFQEIKFKDKENKIKDKTKYKVKFYLWEVDKWKKYDGEELLAGTYKWRIEGKKDATESIDWITDAFGVELDAWAWWNADYERCKTINIGGIITANYRTVRMNVTGLTTQADADDIRIIDTYCNNDGTETKYGLLHVWDTTSSEIAFVANTSKSFNYSIYYKSSTATDPAYTGITITTPSSDDVQQMTGTYYNLTFKLADGIMSQFAYSNLSKNLMGDIDQGMFALYQDNGGTLSNGTANAVCTILDNTTTYVRWSCEDQTYNHVQEYEFWDAPIIDISLVEQGDPGVKMGIFDSIGTVGNMAVDGNICNVTHVFMLNDTQDILRTYGTPVCNPSYDILNINNANLSEGILSYYSNATNEETVLLGMWDSSLHNNLTGARLRIGGTKGAINNVITNITSNYNGDVKFRFMMDNKAGTDPVWSDVQNNYLSFLESGASFEEFTLTLNKTVEGMTFTPTTVYSNTTLSCSFTAKDDDASKSMTSIIGFYNSTELLYQFNNTGVTNATITTIELDSANLTRDETWTCETGLYFAGEGFGTFVNISRSVLDLTPSIPSFLSPATGTISAGNVTITCAGSTDQDGDEVKYELYGDQSNPPTTLLKNNTNGTYIWSTLGAGTNLWRCRAYAGGAESSYTETRTISSTNITTCNGGDGHALNLTLKVENNGTIVVGDIEATFEMWGTNPSQVKTESFALTNKTMNICISPSNITLNYNAKINYISPGFDQRQYYVNSEVLSNTTQNIPLYVLEIVLGSPITFTVKDSSGVKQSGYFIKADRLDIGTNTYSTVAMGKTDADGRDLLFLRKQDAFYRLSVLQGNSVVYVDETARKIIEDSLDLIIGDSSISDIINKFRGISYSLTNTSTQIVLTYSNPPGETIKNCLTVLKRNVTFYDYVFNECSNSSAGTISYTFDGDSASYIGGFYSEINPGFFQATIVVVKTVASVTTSLRNKIGDTGLFAALLLIIFMGTIGVAMGKVSTTVGGTLLGYYFAGIMGLIWINWLSAIGLFVIGVIVISLSKQ